MAKAATTKWNLFLILLNSLGTALSTGTDSLIVKYRTLLGQCSVNEKLLLHLGDGKQKGNDTELCPPLSKSLKETFQELWSLQSGNDALNVTIQSQYKQGKFIDGHWAINTEKYSIYFYPSNDTWRESHSDDSSVSELWKNKKEVEQDFSKFSKGDVCDCLKKWWPHSREMPSK
ncbi:histocompatibility antigen 60b-like [Apodemus sylvaticus]|uniref:histocompatibility antigen 60b-like n=1 Tax=Apodemus sylvaticus TaxID=10129 RepID=UPI00224448F7|nr:histocompatibility antigen 60b-like [Apodemus sylvaticus]